MYRRRFAVNSMRNSARSYYYRIQRMRNPRAWMAGVGCTVLALLALCCLLGAGAVYILIIGPLQRSATDLLLALV